MSNFDISVSALKAFDRKLGVTANNIANVNTNRYKATRTELSEGDNGGVKVSLSKDNRPGVPVEEVQDGRAVQTESSNVDLAQEIPETMTTRHAYGANIKMMKAQDEMLGSLLDIIG